MHNGFAGHARGGDFVPVAQKASEPSRRPADLA